MSFTARRLYLSVSVKLMILAGLVALVTALLSSIGNETSTDGEAMDAWRLELDWTAIAPGDHRVLEWPNGRAIWVYRRHGDEITRLKNRSPADLHDPLSRHSQQPDDLNPAWRSRHPEIFVFFPYETRRGCKVRLEAATRMFVDACHGARFDTAGRLLRQDAGDGQQNLAVPDYELVGERRLRLLPPGV